VAKIVEGKITMRGIFGSMDFGARDFGERDENEQQRRQSPVDVVLGIREELAEFRRNGGKQALLAKLRASREKGSPL
jgi:hypothetical protein